VGVDKSVWEEVGNEDIHKWFANEGYLAKHLEKQKEFEYIDFINAVFKNENISKLHLEGRYFLNMKKAILSNWINAKDNMKDKMHSSLKEKYEWLFEYYNRKCDEKKQMKYAIEAEVCEELKSVATY
jgi:hypothetical protein